jgi:hypothetical protein
LVSTCCCPQRHFGRDARALFDAAAAEVAPVGREVLADRDVQRAAVGQRLSSWKTPLPKVWVPTTVARWWSCSAAVTISEAEAVSWSTSTTIGIRGEIAPPVASSVSWAACARAW